MSKFEVYKDKKGETRFRFRARNGEVVFSSESYKAKASAMKAIESLRKGVAEATVEEVDTAAKTAAKPAAKASAKTAKPSKAAAKPAAKTASKPKTAAKTASKPKAKANA
nr:DUF1508 domain-containing protein [Chelativorans sp.]